MIRENSEMGISQKKDARENNLVYNRDIILLFVYVYVQGGHRGPIG